MDPCILNIAEGLRPIIDGGNIVLELLRKEVFFILSEDDVRVLVSRESRLRRLGSRRKQSFPFSLIRAAREAVPREVAEASTNTLDEI